MLFTCCLCDRGLARMEAGKAPCPAAEDGPPRQAQLAGWKEGDREAKGGPLSPSAVPSGPLAASPWEGETGLSAA